MIRMGAVELESPVMNAGGTCKTLEEVAALARSSAGAVVVGSITVNPRTGNAGEVYWSGANHSLNALGLPNRGIDYYSTVLPEMASVIHEHDKKLIVSVAGFTVDEYVQLACRAAQGGADLIELNLGCPNVWDGGRQKRIASFDHDYTARVCREVSAALIESTRRTRRLTQFGVKISPFSDPVELTRAAQSLARVSEETVGLGFVTATNAFPNAMSLDDDGQPRMTMELGGLGGPAMKPIGLGQVRQLRAVLPTEVAVVGAGGVSNGRDALDYLRVGAVAVQVATAYLNGRNGPGIFADILGDLLVRLP